MKYKGQHGAARSNNNAHAGSWPLQAILSLRSFRARIKPTLHLPVHLHYPPWCNNTNSQLLGSLRPPLRPPLRMPYTILYWWWQHRVKAKLRRTHSSSCSSISFWPLQDILLLRSFCTRINQPCIRPSTCIAHPGAILIHSYWGVYDSVSDLPCVCHTHYNIGSYQYSVTAKLAAENTFERRVTHAQDNTYR